MGDELGGASGFSQVGVDALRVYDSSGRCNYIWARSGEVVDALSKYVLDDRTLFEQGWLTPEAIEELRSASGSRFLMASLNHGKHKIFAASVHVIPVKGDNVFVVHFDWTWQRESMLRTIRLHLLQMARLACVGTLGGPIAHALNNPLAAIRGFAEVLKRRFAQIDRVAYFADKIIANADRMRVTIDQLRMLSRPRPITLASGGVDLNRVIDGTVQIMEEQFKMRNIVIEHDLDATLPRINGDPTQWEALFMSLLAHSRDSFQVQSDQRKRKVKLESYVTGTGVCVRYADTSGGFPATAIGSDKDPMDILLSHDSAIGLPAFVVLEVLRRHGAEVVVRVDTDETTEIVMNLSALAEPWDESADGTNDEALDIAS